MNKDNWEYREVIRPRILKRDNNACRSCKVRNKQKVYVDTRGKYVECDDFVEQWAIANDKKVFSIGLEVVELDPVDVTPKPYNLITLCKRCKRKHLRKMKRIHNKIYRNEMEDLKEFNLKWSSKVAPEVQIILRKEIERITGERIKTSELNKFVSITAELSAFIHEEFNKS